MYSQAPVPVALPSLVVTTTSTLAAAAPAGATKVTDVLVVAVTLAFRPPTVTAAPARLVPLIVADVVLDVVTLPRPVCVSASAGTPK